MKKEQRTKLQEYIDSKHPKCANDLPYPIWEELSKNDKDPFLWEEVDRKIIDDYMIYQSTKRKKK